MSEATLYHRNFRLHLQQLAGYEEPVLIKEPARDEPAQSHIAQLHNEYEVTSAEVAQAMAEAARLHLKADIGIGITGVAGSNEMEGKPAGMVFIGIDNGESKQVIKGNYPGDRAQVRYRAITAALFELRKILVVLD